MTGPEQYVGDLAAAFERKQHVFSPAPDFLAVVRGPEHVFEFVNNAYVQLVGNRQCMGRRFVEVLPEAIADGILDQLDQVYRSGTPFRAQNYHSRLEGGDPDQRMEMLVTFQFRPLRDLDGTISGVYIEGINVTQHAVDEAALEMLQLEARQRWAELETLYESAPVGLALLGAEHFEYRRLNHRQAEILGVTPAQVLGKTVRESSPALADSAEALFRRVVAGEHVRDMVLEGELPARPGEKRSWLVSYSPMRKKDGSVEAIICTALETTELRRAERAAVQNEKLAAVGRLAGSIAHEINNPLEAITNLLFLARNSETLPEAQGYMDSAELELRRVAAITTQTLRFHRQATDPREVSCVELINGGLSIFDGRLHNLNITVEKRKRAHRPVLCFDGEIRQVLNNLIGNAIDAMSASGGRLLLRSREGHDWRTGRPGLWISVADTGSGMSPEAQKHAFEAFFTTKGIAGTGLGLWISCEIVKRHAGNLLLRSSQKTGIAGTVFCLFLPFEAERR